MRHRGILGAIAACLIVGMWGAWSWLIIGRLHSAEVSCAPLECPPCSVDACQVELIPLVTVETFAPCRCLPPVVKVNRDAAIPRAGTMSEEDFR